MNPVGPSTTEHSRAALISLAAVAIAGVATVGALHLQPFSDPVELVGVPLLLEYSKASERPALFAFAATTVSVAFLARRFGATASPTARDWVLLVACAGI